MMTWTEEMIGLEKGNLPAAHLGVEGSSSDNALNPREWYCHPLSVGTLNYDGTPFCKKNYLVFALEFTSSLL